MQEAMNPQTATISEAAVERRRLQLRDQLVRHDLLHRPHGRGEGFGFLRWLDVQPPPMSWQGWACPPLRRYRFPPLLLPGVISSPFYPRQENRHYGGIDDKTHSTLDRMGFILSP